MDLSLQGKIAIVTGAARGSGALTAKRLVDDGARVVLADILDDRGKPVAEALIKNYNLANDSSVLDVGCGKAYLLYEMKLLLPELKIVGFDISKHGLAEAKEEI